MCFLGPLYVTSNMLVLIFLLLSKVLVKFDIDNALQRSIIAILKVNNIILSQFKYNNIVIHYILINMTIINTKHMTRNPITI